MFASYAFAPLSLIVPLGAVSVIGKSRALPQPSPHPQGPVYPRGLHGNTGTHTSCASGMVASPHRTCPACFPGLNIKSSQQTLEEELLLFPLKFFVLFQRLTYKETRREREILHLLAHSYEYHNGYI